MTPERKAQLEDLVFRLRGIYRIPITDGHGPAGGEEPDNPHFHVRSFDRPGTSHFITPINKEAARAIEELLAELENNNDA